MPAITSAAAEELQEKEGKIFTHLSFRRSFDSLVATLIGRLCLLAHRWAHHPTSDDKFFYFILVSSVSPTSATITR
jgi:hypothetical protein